MKINEFEKGGVTQQQLDALEKVLDQVFSKVGIDIEFTRHFIDRVNDERNIKPISIKELAMLFKKEFIKYGKPIAQLGPDAQAVMKDLESDINIPFALEWNGKELELIAKTVMRKKNFKTPNKEFAVENDNQSGVYKDEKNNVEIHWQRSNHPNVAKDYLDMEAYQNGKPVDINNQQADYYRYLINQKMNENTIAEDFDWSQTAAGKRGLKDPGNKPIVKTLGKKEPFTNNDWSRTSAGKKGLKNPGPRKPMAEDFGSVPPLAELILMAVVAKTSVDVLIGMFKVALKTGKGLKKLNDLRKRVTKMGQGVADYALPEATKDEFMAKLKDQQKNKFIDAAIEALHRLVTSKGGRQTIGGYAFDIARAFNGVNAKELEKMYRAKFSESIIHEDTLNELNILRKKNDGVKQSNPLVVLDKLSDRNDDTPFPIKFYDGTSIKVTPKMARRFMNKYYDDLEPEQRDIIDRYVTTKNGFIQAVKKLQIAEGK
jgi:hypothetical protein